MLKEYFKYKEFKKNRGERIKYLQGLRAIACMVVVVHHYLMIFSPEVPQKFINDGHLAVMLFMLLTGIVIPFKTYENEALVTVRDKCVESFRFVVKRYFRLLPLISISIVGSWILLKINQYYIQELSMILKETSLRVSFSNQDVGLKQVFYDIFFGAYVNGSSLNSPLWTICYEFSGAIIVYILVILFGQVKFRSIIYLLFGLFVYKYNRDEYFLSMITGVIYSDIFINKNDSLNIVKKIKSLLNYRVVQILGGFVIWGLYISPVFDMRPTYYRRVVASGLVLLILVNGTMQRILSCERLPKFAKYSFEIYVLHWPIMCSLSCYLMLFALERGYNYYISSGIILAISLICIFICAYLVNRILIIIGRIVNDKTILLIDKRR